MDNQKQLAILVKPYSDPDTVYTSGESTRLSCKVGSYTFNQEIVGKEQMLTVECLVNVANFFYRPSILLQSYIPTISSLSPRFAFVDELNIAITVAATPLNDLLSLKCRLNDVVLKGSYVIVDGNQAIRCTIPSVIFLNESTKLALPASNIWQVQVSLDGIYWSKNQVSFKFLEKQQILDLSIFVGPETGGTLVTVTVNDLPPIDATPTLPVVYFEFPGYETDSNYRVTATFVSLNTITCVTPPLKITQTLIDAGKLDDFDTFTLARVNLNLLGRRVNDYFYFTYMKEVHVFELDPPNYVFIKELNPLNGLMEYNHQSRNVKVIGQHFMPTEEQLFCRIGFSPVPAIVQAVYLFNNTVECPVPSPPSDLPLPLYVPIELSFNQAQQFSSSSIIFSYIPKETVTHIYPTRQYVKGNELVKVFTSYFFDKAAPTAKCKFAYTDAFGTFEYF